jgi:transposase
VGEFERGYGEEGPPAYAPALMVKVWLYALGVMSSRRLEQRIREDLGFRYLAGGATPDHWTLNEFRRRHRRALNDLFTQVLEVARDAGLGRLGHVAIDSTWVAANASQNRVESEDGLRRERAKLRRQVRRWQQQCDATDPNETPGTELSSEAQRALAERLAAIPGRLQKLAKAGQKKRSLTDPDSRFLRERQGFTLGYAVAMAVSEDHVIVEQQVTQAATDNASLVPLVEAVERRCGEMPQKVSADCGFFSVQNLVELAARGIDAYVPDLERDYPECYIFGVLPAYGLYVHHATGLTLNNVQFHLESEDVRPAIVCDDVQDVELTGFKAEGNVKAESLIRLQDTQQVFITGSRPLKRIGAFLRVEGPRSREICLSGNELGLAQKAVDIAGELQRAVVLREK